MILVLLGRGRVVWVGISQTLGRLIVFGNFPSLGFSFDSGIRRFDLAFGWSGLEFANFGFS